MAEQLKTIDKSNWDTFGIDLAAQIARVRNANRPRGQGDPASRRRDRDGQSRSSWAGIDAYEKPAADLARQKLDQVVWYDTEHPVAAALIGNLTRIFAEVPKPADIRKQLADRKADLFKTLRPKFGGYGLLLRDDAGKWTVRTRGVPASGATAVVDYPNRGHAAPGGVATTRMPGSRRPRRWIHRSLSRWPNGKTEVGSSMIRPPATYHRERCC